jgi:hypothetical protein
MKTCNANLGILLGIVIVSVMLLSASFALDLHVAKGKKQNSDKIAQNKFIIQNKCSGSSISNSQLCVNIICMGNAACVLGDNQPFLLPTPQ